MKEERKEDEGKKDDRGLKDGKKVKRNEGRRKQRIGGRNE
jgi:hypothetical protein